MATDKEKREIEIVLNAQQANASIKDMAAGVALMNNQLAKMTQDDPRRAQLKRDFDVLSERVGAARKEMRTYVQTEEELRAATEKLNQENVQVILNGQKLNSSFKDMKASAAQLEQQLHGMNSDAPGRKKMLDDYHALQGRIEGVTNEMKHATEGASFFKQGFANAFAFATGGGIEAAVGKIFELGQSIFTTTAKFQTYETIMTNALGDKSKAQKALQDIQTMAARTPFSVDELTSSFIKFVNRGLNPSMAEMTKMADLAASQGKSFDQLTEAILDAGGGEFERLKEFGIKASKSGDQVSLSFKGINQTVKSTPEAINAAIEAFGGMKGVAGTTAAVSATLDGQWSNLGDTAGQLEVKVGKGLMPVFTFILGLFGRFLDWIGRFSDGIKPLGELFSEIGQELKGFYTQIGDVLESLGLFSDKTDTVKIVVEILKVAFTVLLIPLRALVLINTALINGFVDLYNKSELVRGVLGGLGAVVMSVFTTIKNDALKVLGGVGDIIVGIFTLDKNKIVAGFKAALAATADAALEGGSRAASQFMKGYDANKNNKIVRRVSVETSETTTGQPAGDDLKSDKSGADATAAKKAEAAAKKAKQDRDKADRDHLSALKATIKEEGGLLEGRNALRDQLDRTNISDEMRLREDERQKLFDAAAKKIEALTGQELDYTEQVATIVADRDVRLRELFDKHAEEEEQRRKKALDKQIADANADEQVLLAQADLNLANKLLTTQQHEDAVYAIKKAAAERELDLVRQRDGADSTAAKKLQAEKLKGEADHIKKVKTENESLTKFKKGLSAVDKLMNDEGVQFLADSLGKQTIAYKAYQVARKATAIADIGVKVIEEVQTYWATAATLGPIAGPIYGTAMSALAIARGIGASAKIAGFAQGGATGDGAVVAPGPGAAAGSGMWDVFSQATGMRVGTNGKLSDGSGHDVAGIVHANEYVIPAWMRVDPQVIQAENWLETRRLRGYAQGGATTDGGSQAPPVEAGAPAASDAGQERLLQVLTSLDGRLQGVQDWATQLQVVNDLLGLSRELEKLKKVQNNSGIGTKKD